MLQILYASIPVRVRGAGVFFQFSSVLFSHDGLQVCGCDSLTSRALQRGFCSLVVLAYVIEVSVDFAAITSVWVAS